MKLEPLKMNLKSLKSRVNNERGWLFKGKSSKNAITFKQNKPNSPNVQIHLTSFITMNYPILPSLTKVKNKPKQTQFKPNSNPIAKRPKMNASIYHTKVYSNKTAFGRNKNKPNSNPIKPVLGVCLLALEFTLGVCFLAHLPGVGDKANFKDSTAI